jgi:hypothetical protein
VAAHTRHGRRIAMAWSDRLAADLGSPVRPMLALIFARVVTQVQPGFNVWMFGALEHPAREPGFCSNGRVRMNGESCRRCRPRCGVEEPQVRVVARIAALPVNTQRGHHLRRA